MRAPGCSIPIWRCHCRGRPATGCRGRAETSAYELAFPARLVRWLDAPFLVPTKPEASHHEASDATSTTLAALAVVAIASPVIVVPRAPGVRPPVVRARRRRSALPECFPAPAAVRRAGRSPDMRDSAELFEHDAAVRADRHVASVGAERGEHRPASGSSIATRTVYSAPATRAARARRPPCPGSTRRPRCAVLSASTRVSGPAVGGPMDVRSGDVGGRFDRPPALRLRRRAARVVQQCREVLAHARSA